LTEIASTVVPRQEEQAKTSGSDDAERASATVSTGTGATFGQKYSASSDENKEQSSKTSDSDNTSKSRDERSREASSSDTSEKDTNDSSPDSADESSDPGAATSDKDGQNDVKVGRSKLMHAAPSSATLQDADKTRSTSTKASGKTSSSGDAGAISPSGVPEREASGPGSADVIGVSAASAEDSPILVECSGTDGSIWKRSGDESGETGLVLLIKNINQRTTVPEFCALLEEQGWIVSPEVITFVHIPCNRRKGKARGYVVVRCATTGLALQLMQQFDGLKLKGHRKFRCQQADRLQNTGFFDSVGKADFPEGYEPRSAVNEL
jgi:hypothetical protein